MSYVVKELVWSSPPYSQRDLAQIVTATSGQSRNQAGNLLRRDKSHFL